MKKFTLICTTLLLAALAFNNYAYRGLMSWLNTPTVTRAEISGKDGELTVTSPNTIVNKYGKLAADAAMGASVITVVNPGGPNGLDVNTLTPGDLIMIIQMAGASIENSNSINYGTVTNLNSAGRHEFVTVNQAQGNVITINPPCGGLRFNYSANGRTQVIRVPQYTKLTINSGASLTAPAWNGVTGGIVVVDVQDNAIINGNIDVSGLGFRGGGLSNTSVNFGRTDYVGPLQDFGGEKGEGIAGSQSDYDLTGGRYARGAAANGGGGGTDHNSGGGGGANGNNGKVWSGQGVMDGTVTGASAWALDPGYIANGNKLTDSSGGGRGGYSYATADGNALTQGPGNDAWMGDKRREVGGLGGRPVAQDTSGRIFLGGGGGAGAQNNDTGGAGGNGGGLIYIIADTVSGSGMLKANGASGGNTRDSHRDGAGGGGGGGTIVVAAKTSLGGISAQANGGSGGNQSPPTGAFAAESEGPGGGGGGGYIAFSGGSISTQVNGGVNGISLASSVSEFPSNGATRGANGLVNNSVGSIPFCSTTSDLSITKTDNQTSSVPGAPTTYTIVARNNGPNDVFGIPVTDNLPPVFLNASWTCTASAGSKCQANSGTGSINTKVDLLNGGTATFTLTATPDPSAVGTITNTATIGMPGGAVDPNPTNDTASDTNTLTPLADLSVTKTDGTNTVVAGTQTMYTITVRNNGPSTVKGATVSDIVPTKLTNVTWTCTASSGGVCGSPSGSGSINTTVDLLPGNTATFKLNATVVNSATGSLSNTATVAAPASTPDPTPGNNSDTDVNSIAQTVDLAITKTNNATSVVPGTQTTYTIVVSNSGPSAITGAAVADNLPANLTNASWTCTASAGSSCGSANGTGSINNTVDLAVNGTATYSLTATISPNATGNVTNTATIAPPPGAVESNPANNSATDTDTLNLVADLSITKSNNATTVTAGSQTTYTIIARNNGPSSITGATVTDSLPPQLINASWTCTASAGSSCGSPNGSGNINATVNLAANGTATFTLTATVRSDATGTISNTATVVAPNGVTDPTGNNNSGTDTDAVAQSSDLSITKTNNSTVSAPGTQTTYSIVVSNSGPSAITGATVTDNLPASFSNATWTCAASSGSSCSAPNGNGNINTTVNLAVGGTATFNLTATISSTVTGTLTNIASVAPPTGATDPNPGNNSASDTDQLSPIADLSITKTNNVSTLVPGTQTTYTVVVSNAGPSAVTGATVTDIMPSMLVIGSWSCVASAGSSCAVPNGNVNINTTVNLAAGGTATFTINATAASTATGTITNTATVTAPSGTSDPNPANNSASDTDTLTPVSDLAITKTNNGSTVTAGNQVIYTITVTNNGPSAVTGASVVDTLPAGLTNATWNCLASSGSSCGAANGTGSINTTVNLANGGAATFTLTATVAGNALGTLTNTASVATPAGTSDPTPGNNSASDTDTVISRSDLRISKTANPVQPIPGSTFNYTIVVTNDGPSPVTGATVTDTIPALLTNVTWTCTASSGSSCVTANGTGNINATVNLANGGTATFTITASVPTNATGTVTNTANVTAPSGVTDPDSNNNSSTVISTLQPRSDLSITKVANTSVIRAGDQLTYTITAINNGPSAASGVVVTDPLPSGVSLVSATSTKGSCTGTTTVTCNIGTLAATAPDNTAVITIKIQVPFTFPVGNLSNSVTVTSSTVDPTGNNNSGTSTVTVNPPPGAQVRNTDVSIRVTGSDVCIGSGNVLNIEIKLKNSGDGIQNDNPGPELTALLPTQLTTVPGTCTSSAGGTCTLGSAQVEWNGGIPVNATVTISFQVRVRQGVTPGTRFCTDYRVNFDTNSDNINDASTVVTNCLTANCTPDPCSGPDCPNVGPGIDINDFNLNPIATGSDQRPGSVLVFPLYTSSVANPNAENTRISMTNVHAARPAFLHLFFLDGSNCSVADNFICLTPNQSTSFLVSDLDPGVTGYLIAVAVDSKGCPVNFNYLIGDEYVKLTSGHSANLGAEAIAAISATPVDCGAASSTATMNFDGLKYNLLGRVIAADGLPSRGDGNDTLIVLNRIGGNLGLGATPLGSLFGIFYDDTENAVSFTFNSGLCQFRSSISNSFPRITPRFEQFVPAGRTGWVKIGISGTSAEGAIIGAVLNLTSNQSGFTGGRNFNKVTLGTSNLVIPVFPPSCQ